MKSSRAVKIITLMVIASAGALITYNYVFNAKHRNIANEEATASLSAEALYTKFEANEAAATKSFLDQVIELKGEITSVEDTGVVLNNKAEVSFDSTETSKPKAGEVVSIKGRCVGYDELLEVVKIDQAILVNKN